jgi:hypothetical protein
MAHLLKRIMLLLVVVAVPAAPVAARADTTSAARAEAKKHYDRAMELNEDGQTAEAVIELKRAYELAPHHTVLYNLGQAYITLAKPVEAVAALQRYLDEGGKAIKPARRTEVEQEIARQKTRIATLEIRGLPDGTMVTIDGDDVGTAPLASAVRVGVGKHVVAATAVGREPGEAKIEVAGEDKKVVELKLVARAGQPATAAGAVAGLATPRPALPAAATSPASVAAATSAAVPAASTPIPVAPNPAPAAPMPAAAPDLSPNPATWAQPSSEASPVSPQGEAPKSPEPSEWSGLRTAGIVAASVGVVGLVVGGALWQAALDKNNDAGSQWQINQSQARSTRSDAEGLATGANVCLIVGGVLAGVGVIMTLLTFDDDSPFKSAAFAPTLGPNFTGVTMKGTW